MKFASALLAGAVTAQTFEWGGCVFKDWEVMTNGKTYDGNGGMNDTFYQIGALTDTNSGWVPPCTRHELI